MMSWQQANFNSQMRSKPFTADVVAGYSGKVSSLRWNVYRTNITSPQTVNLAVHRMQMARYLSGITHAHWAILYVMHGTFASYCELPKIKILLLEIKLNVFR